MVKAESGILSSSSRSGGRKTDLLLRLARENSAQVLDTLTTSREGLADSEAAGRLAQYGPNAAAQSKRKSWFSRLTANLKNPLVILLAVLATISLATGDLRAALIMLSMIVLGVSLRYFQELNADKAAEELKAMVSTKVTVVRNGAHAEIDLQQVVPGDVLVLCAGDVVAADARIITSKDLFVNQSALTGESLPAEKHATADPDAREALDCQDLCFQGSHVESGTALAVAVTTGANTYFGALAKTAMEKQVPTAFEIGISKFTWLMISFIAVMVPVIFVINGVFKNEWLSAFMFALAVGVGLTPEMLPAIVTVNLSKGALQMSKEKVIIKHLDAIQNLGAMDVLCMDKTGTLTQGRVILEKHVDVNGDESDEVLNWAFLNSFYQTGLKNMTDIAVLEHEDMQAGRAMQHLYRKLDEIPFDFVRRRMSVVVEDAGNTPWLICKGAVEEVLALCISIKDGQRTVRLDDRHREAARSLARNLNEDGFRVIALSIKEFGDHQTAYEASDESTMTLVGFLAFLDPPKESATEALRQLAALGVEPKVLTGDNDIITRKICKQVEMIVTGVLLGSQIDAMSDSELQRAVADTNVFAKLSPSNKVSVIASLQKNGHVVGFLGDGINDAPSLRSADVGISVDSAVDIAREASDIILLEKSLLVLSDGITAGRKVFCNITKYIKMAASSNFGNMFSVVGASIFLPFLPMLPIQILTNNLLYDFSQTTIPTDDVDEEWLRTPRKWEIRNLRKFILFIGPVSSIFDYATFAALIFLFGAWTNPALFHTGWFVESLLTQTLIIHVIRTNKIPFIQSHASIPLTATTILVCLSGIVLPFSPLGKALGFVPLPLLYWPVLAAFLVSYVVLTQLVKTSIVRAFEF